MAQEIREPKTLETSDECRMATTPFQSDPSLSRNASSSRLNARAPEFVPRAPPPANQGPNRVKFHHPHHHQPHPPPVMHVVYHHSPPPPPPPQVTPQFVVPAPGQGMYHHHDYYGEHEVDLDQVQPPSLPMTKDGLSEDIMQKITKQVEYYFSDLNLATTEHLMKFISKDPEGFVPITVIASFKKIKALVHNNSFLADALRTSSKLVVSEDGKKVRRHQPFTESDVEELQTRIVVAENLPENHCYQSLMKIFSIAGSVKTIRTCYPQTPNGTTTPTNRSSKMEMLFSNKLHAFVEYETVDDAEKAVIDLNDERNWRSGLRVRLLSSCMAPPKQGQGRVRKSGHEVDGNIEDEDASVPNQPKHKQVEQDPPQSAETSLEQLGEEVTNDRESGPARRGKGRARGGAGGGGKGRGRGHHTSSSNNNNNSYNYHHRSGGGHAIGTPPSSHPIHNEPAVTKQPPGPRMPDGTRGFTMGRGKPIPAASTSSTV